MGANCAPLHRKQGNGGAKDPRGLQLLLATSAAGAADEPASEPPVKPSFKKSELNIQTWEEAFRIDYMYYTFLDEEDNDEDSEHLREVRDGTLAFKKIVQGADRKVILPKPDWEGRLCRYDTVFTITKFSTTEKELIQATADVDLDRIKSMASWIFWF